MISTSFRRLEVFVEAVQAGSFQSCGDRLGISQASVSNHIRALEEQLGKQLFARRRGAAGALTEEGARIYEVAKDLMQRAERLFEGSPAGKRPRPRRQIRLGVHGYIARRLTQPLTRIVLDQPNLDIVLENVPYEVFIEGFVRGRFDLGFFFASGNPVEIEAAPVCCEPIGLYAASGHPLAALPSVTAADLAAHPFIPLPPSAHLRRVVAKSLDRVGLTDLPVAFETDDAYLAMEAAAQGTAYVCLFRRGVTEDAVASGRLHPLAIELPGVDIQVAIHRRHRLDRTVQDLANFLSDSLRADLRSWFAETLPSPAGNG